MGTFKDSCSQGVPGEGRNQVQGEDTEGAAAHGHHPVQQGPLVIQLALLPQPEDDELQSYFMGVESEFENIVSVKSVIQNFEDGVGSANGKCLGVLVQFENKAALDKFVSLGEIKYKEKVVRYNN